MLQYAQSKGRNSIDKCWYIPVSLESIIPQTPEEAAGIAIMTSKLSLFME